MDNARASANACFAELKQPCCKLMSLLQHPQCHQERKSALLQLLELLAALPAAGVANCCEYVLFPIQFILLPVAQDGVAKVAIETQRAASDVALSVQSSILGAGRERAGKLEEAELALECLNRLLVRCGPVHILSNGPRFCDIMQRCLMVLPIPHPDGSISIERTSSGLGESSEELRFAAVTCLCSLFTNTEPPEARSSSKVAELLRTEGFRLQLGHCLSLLLGLSGLERHQQLKLTAVRALQRLCALTYDADTLACYLPGISSALVSLLLERPTRSSSRNSSTTTITSKVAVAALEAWILCLTLTIGDTMSSHLLPTSSALSASTAAVAIHSLQMMSRQGLNDACCSGSCNTGSAGTSDSTASTSREASKRGKRNVPKVERDVAWLLSTAAHLAPAMRAVRDRLARHSNSTVRAALATGYVTLLQSCGRVFASVDSNNTNASTSSGVSDGDSIVLAVTEALVMLGEDSTPHVAQVAHSGLALPPIQIRELWEARMVHLLGALPKVVRRDTDNDTRSRVAIQVLCGYLRLLYDAHNQPSHQQQQPFISTPSSSISPPLNALDLALPRLLPRLCSLFTLDVSAGCVGGGADGGLLLRLGQEEDKREEDECGDGIGMEQSIAGQAGSRSDRSSGGSNSSSKPSHGRVFSYTRTSVCLRFLRNLHAVQALRQLVRLLGLYCTQVTAVIDILTSAGINKDKNEGRDMHRRRRKHKHGRGQRHNGRRHRHGHQHAHRFQGPEEYDENEHKDERDQEREWRWVQPQAVSIFLAEFISATQEATRREQQVQTQASERANNSTHTNATAPHLSSAAVARRLLPSISVLTHSLLHCSAWVAPTSATAGALSAVVAVTAALVPVGGAGAGGLELSAVDLQMNANGVALLLEVMGCLAESLAADSQEHFRFVMMDVLYPVVEKLADPHPIVRVAAQAVLQCFSHNCGYICNAGSDTSAPSSSSSSSSISTGSTVFLRPLLQDNLDYLIDSIIVRLKGNVQPRLSHANVDVRASMRYHDLHGVGKRIQLLTPLAVVSALIRECGVAALPLMQDALAALLDCIDEHCMYARDIESSTEGNGGTAEAIAATAAAVAAVPEHAHALAYAHGRGGGGSSGRGHWQTQEQAHLQLQQQRQQQREALGNVEAHAMLSVMHNLITVIHQQREQAGVEARRKQQQESKQGKKHDEKQKDVRSEPVLWQTLMRVCAQCDMLAPELSSGVTHGEDWRTKNKKEIREYFEQHHQGKLKRKGKAKYHNDGDDGDSTAAVKPVSFPIRVPVHIPSQHSLPSQPAFTGIGTASTTTAATAMGIDPTLGPGIGEGVMCVEHDATTAAVTQQQELVVSITDRAMYFVSSPLLASQRLALLTVKMGLRTLTMEPPVHVVAETGVQKENHDKYEDEKEDELKEEEDQDEDEEEEKDPKKKVQKQLLPLVHRIWPSLLACFQDCLGLHAQHMCPHRTTTNSSASAVHASPTHNSGRWQGQAELRVPVLVAALELVTELAELCGDFVQGRFSEQLWPVLQQLLLLHQREHQRQKKEQKQHQKQQHRWSSGAVSSPSRKDLLLVDCQDQGTTADSAGPIAAQKRWEKQQAQWQEQHQQQAAATASTKVQLAVLCCLCSLCRRGAVMDTAPEEEVSQSLLAPHIRDVWEMTIGYLSEQTTSILRHEALLLHKAMIDIDADAMWLDLLAMAPAGLGIPPSPSPQLSSMSTTPVLSFSVPPSGQPASWTHPVALRSWLKFGTDKSEISFEAPLPLVKQYAQGGFEAAATELLQKISKQR